MSVKLAIPAKTLTEAVKWAANGIPARAVLPVLSGVKLTAADGTLTAEAFDYETSYAITVPAEVGAPGTVLVPGRQLLAMLRQLPRSKTPVTLESDGATLTLRSGPAALTLAALDLAEYPQLPAMPRRSGRIGAADLGTAIGQVIPAASRDDRYPPLTGVRAETTRGGMLLAATDRYRLHTAPARWSTPGRTAPAITIPAVPLAAWAKTVKTGDVTVHLAKDRAGFSDGARTMTTRTVDGDFPRYGSIMPGDDAPWDSRLTADAATLAGMAGRIGKLSGRDGPVTLAADDTGTATVETRDADGAVSSETMTGVTVDGNPVRINFTAAFLGDALSAHQGDVTLQIRGARPVLFTSPGTACRTLAMPQRTS